MGDTTKSPTVSTKLQWVAEQSARYPEKVITSLAHLMDVELLFAAYCRTRKDGAVGVDGVTACEYAENLEENLVGLHARLRSGQYRAPAVKRAWLEKDDGSQRPLGIPAFEDKIVQRAVTMLLSAVYEQEFYDFSYGFRPGRSPHQALKVLREKCFRYNVNWIVDADVSGFFDNLDHGLLREIIKRRVNDGGLLRLIGKWLNAGVLDGEQLYHPIKGAPQGGVVSPILANIFLHHVLDEWFVKEIRPRLKGRGFLIRFADDFVIGCELEEDARRLMAVLPKRFSRFKLTIHPKKSRLVEFRTPDMRKGVKSESSTFDFLGFTHYWAKSRRGNWVIKRKTAAKRLRRAMHLLWRWCQYNRHLAILEQYRILCSKLRGHYQYYGIRCNFRMLERVYFLVRRAWRRWLGRRHRSGHISVEKFKSTVEATCPLPKPKIVHNI
jgi:group II intron reverse transcriptase/maturase